MTKGSQHPADSEHPAGLDKSVERRRRQIARWEKEGERSLGQNLAMIGSLGWSIVIPMLAGIFAGRWLDQRLGTGITLTAALLFLGLAVGSWSAWRRMRKE